MLDAVVVGAGPVGCRVANLLAFYGYKVVVVEEHKEIGKPLKCAGLVSWRLLKLLPEIPREIILNEVKRAKFFSPNENCFELKSKKPMYVIDRYKLDNYLYKKAVESGAKIEIHTRFNSFKYAKDGVKIFTNKKMFKCKLLIGADGANSKVAREAGIKQPPTKLVGIQSTVNGSFDESMVELWFGSSIAPNFFGWVVPENENTARIGIATLYNAKNYFQNFIKIRVGKIHEPCVGGIIPYGIIEKSVSKRILLVGDSAYQVKPFSGGGVIYGLISSKYCVDASVNALENNRFDENFLMEEYDKKWKEKLEKPIRKGMLYRKILDKLDNNQIDFLFSLIKTIKLRKILELFDVDLLREKSLSLNYL